MSDSDGSKGDRKRIHDIVYFDSLESELRLRNAGSAGEVNLIILIPTI